MNLKTLFILFITIFLFACEKQPQKEIKEVKVEEYTITLLDKPKHFYVNLKHTLTGTEFYRVGQSKRCSNWSQFPVNTKIQVKTIYYLDGTFSVDSNNVKQIICQ